MKKKFFSLVLAVITIMSCMMFIACSPKAENPITYTVTFDSVGGSAVASQTIKEGEFIVEPTAPTKAGDTFLYWYLDKQSNIFNFMNRPKADMTLKACWESDPILYTIFYKIGDVVVATEEIGRNGYFAKKPQNPTQAGKTFAYWHLEGEKDPFIFDENQINRHITLKATFLDDEVQAGNIKFYLSTEAGNTMVSGITASQQSITASAGDTISLPRLSAPINFVKFRGWVNATTGEKYLIEDYPNSADYKFTYDGSALIMYAIWE